MTILTAETTEFTVAELHDLDSDSFQHVYVKVSRRVEPGAGAFTGVPFLSPSEDAAKFNTVTEALTFIDALHSDGIPGGIRETSDEQLDDADVVDRLQYANDDMTATEYLEKAGLNDPFNLDISPIVETTKEIPTENTTATASSKS